MRSVILIGLVLLVTMSFAWAQEGVVVRGLLKDMAVLEVNGKMRTIRAGETSPEGVHLVSADSSEAVVEINGDRQTLTLTRQVGGGPVTELNRPEARIAQGVGGHYWVRGNINDIPADMLIDTGATWVAMNSLVAEKMHINYQSGRPVQVSTASGVAQGYLTKLRSVTVGGVRVENVEAVVLVGASPSEILLGNSYLSRVEMRIDQGVMVLQTKF